MLAAAGAAAAATAATAAAAAAAAAGPIPSPRSPCEWTAAVAGVLKVRAAARVGWCAPRARAGACALRAVLAAGAAPRGGRAARRAARVIAAPLTLALPARQTPS
jgi:hypothetical protein